MDPLKIKIIISLDKPDKVCVISSDINMILKPACKIRFSDVSGEILLISLFMKLLLFSLLYKYFPFSKSRCKKRNVLVWSVYKLSFLYTL